MIYMLIQKVQIRAIRFKIWIKQKSPRSNPYFPYLNHHLKSFLFFLTQVSGSTGGRKVAIKYPHFQPAIKKSPLGFLSMLQDSRQDSSKNHSGDALIARCE